MKRLLTLAVLLASTLVPFLAQAEEPVRIYYAGSAPNTGGAVPVAPPAVDYHEPVYLFFASQVPVPSPSWAEFCPQQFVNVQPATTYNSADQTLMASAAAASIRRRPRQVDVEKQAQYWAQRRAGFENAIATCNTQERINDCYLQVRKTEEFKNDEYRKAQRPQPQSVLVPLPMCQSNGAGGYMCFGHF